MSVDPITETETVEVVDSVTIADSATIAQVSTVSEGTIAIATDDPLDHDVVVTQVPIVGEIASVVTSSGSQEVVVSGLTTIGIVSVGVQGPPGADGPPGAAYVYQQVTPSASWLVDHQLGYFPNVTTVDTTDRMVQGDVTYVDQNTLTIDFSAAFSGKAYLS
jgi:hypothetical protein